MTTTGNYFFMCEPVKNHYRHRNNNSPIPTDSNRNKPIRESVNKRFKGRTEPFPPCLFSAASTRRLHFHSLRPLFFYGGLEGKKRNQQLGLFRIFLNYRKLMEFFAAKNS